jgi:hypothetical protein
VVIGVCSGCLVFWIPPWFRLCGARYLRVVFRVELIAEVAVLA